MTLYKTEGCLKVLPTLLPLITGPLKSSPKPSQFFGECTVYAAKSVAL